MDQKAESFYTFGPFLVDARERLLLRNGKTVPLTPKAFDTLLVLVKHAGHTISKDELMKQVWPDSFVEEVNLAHNISVLRKALGEGVNGDRYIDTVPRRGYRFVSTVIQEPSRENGVLHLDERRKATAQVEEGSYSIEPKQEDPGVPASDASRAATRSRYMLVSVSCTLLLGVSAAAIYLWPSAKPKPPIPAIRSIAVLPFASLNTGAQDEYVGLGMADALITKLSGLRQLIVRPTTSVRRYADVEQDPIAAGRQLQVESVLVGSTQKSGDRLRLTLQLVNVEDGRSLWSYKCDDSCSDIFTAQDSISEKVAEALTVRLAGEELKQLSKHYTENTEAFNLYQLGRYHLDRRSGKQVEKSVEYFDKAIEVDPGYALAYAGLSEAYVSLILFRRDLPVNLIPKAKAAALRAIELDDNLAEGHISLALALTCDFARGYDTALTEREFKRAIELSPNSVLARRWYALFLAEELRFGEAVAVIQLALEIEPLSVVQKRFFAQILYLARRYDEAIDQCQKALELDPHFLTAYFWLASSYEMKRMYDDAVAARLKALTLTAKDLKTVEAAQKAYTASGWKGFWRNFIAMKKKQSSFNPYDLAEAYVRVGENEQALHWIGKAFEQQNGMLVELKADPIWDTLRSDQRFADLLRRIYLVQ